MPQPLNRFALALALVLTAAGAASADEVSDAISQQLRQQGYTDITVTRTFLGRDRILATSPTREREIIVNPRTREILRDYTETRDGAAGDDGTRRGLLDLFGTSGDAAGAGTADGGDSGSASGDGDSGDSGDSGGESGDGGDGDGGEGGDD